MRSQPITIGKLLIPYNSARRQSPNKLVDQASLLASLLACLLACMGK